MQTIISLADLARPLSGRSQRAKLLTSLLKLEHPRPYIACQTDHPVPNAQDARSLLRQRQLHHSRTRKEADQTRPEEQLPLGTPSRDIEIAGQNHPISLDTESGYPFFVQEVRIAVFIPVADDLVITLEQRRQSPREPRWKVVVDEKLQAALRN